VNVDTGQFAALVGEVAALQAEVAGLRHSLTVEGATGREMLVELGRALERAEQAARRVPRLDRRPRPRHLRLAGSRGVSERSDPFDTRLQAQHWAEDQAGGAS
jgi:hypothetical protein